MVEVVGLEFWVFDHGGAFIVEVVGLGSWWRSWVLGFRSLVMESFHRLVGLGHGGCGGDG